MNGNKFGRWMGISGFGESHGAAMGVLLEDIKPGVEFPLAEIEQELERRRPGIKDFTSSRQESDRIKILSGVIEGKTTGMPVCLVIYNEDQRSSDYESLREIFRPGHADWSWFQKFKILDWRGGGRASGRETIARVAAGAVVKKMLSPIKLEAYPVQIGKVKTGQIQADFTNQFCWHDPETYEALLKELHETQSNGDSVGGIIEVRISEVPVGLGDPVFGKLEAKLSEAVLSIGGVKGVEFGAGFNLAELHGSEANDQMGAKGFLSNNCGGILGGVSTGEDIIMRLAVKPTPSISLKQQTIDHNGKEREISINGRHDICLIFRILPVVEAMVRLVLADCLSYQKLLCGDTLGLADYREALDGIDEDILLALKRRDEIVKSIGRLKCRQGIKIRDNQREEELLSGLREKAETWGVDVKLVEKLWQGILIQSRSLQESEQNDSDQHNPKK